MAGPVLDKGFATTEAWFAISLLRQSRAKATSRPFAVGDPDEALDTGAAEAHRRLLEHLSSLPQEQQRDAMSVLFWAMIREHLHVATHRPAEWRGN
jgi:hypothetical protein